MIVNITYVILSIIEEDMSATHLGFLSGQHGIFISEIDISVQVRAFCIIKYHPHMRQLTKDRLPYLPWPFSRCLADIPDASLTTPPQIHHEQRAVPQTPRNPSLRASPKWQYICHPQSWFPPASINAHDPVRKLPPSTSPELTPLTMPYK